jgi:hypothetical protein
MPWSHTPHTHTTPARARAAGLPTLMHARVDARPPPQPAILQPASMPSPMKEAAIYAWEPPIDCLSCPPLCHRLPTHCCAHRSTLAATAPSPATVPAARVAAADLPTTHVATALGRRLMLQVPPARPLPSVSDPFIIGARYSTSPPPP